MYRQMLLLAFTLVSSVADPAVIAQGVKPVTLKIFTDLGLTAQQTAAIDAGRPVAKVISWGGPSEVFVFGAVHIDGSPEAIQKIEAIRRAEEGRAIWNHVKDRALATQAKLMLRK